MSHETFDAVVLGGNIRGLLTAYVLGMLGYRAVLIERSPRLGGADGSFKTAGGISFELGMHVMDDERMTMATRLFRHVLDDRVHRVQLKRGLVLRGQIVPYAPTREQLPPGLRELVREGALVDDIGDRVPTRAALGAIYGQGFADFAFDEVLASFPSEVRHRQFGVDESRLMANIYPWFFPRAARRAATHDESSTFHDRLRAGIPQYILYPRAGGFGGFAQALRDKLPAGIEVVTNAADVQLQLAPGTHTVEHVSALGRRFAAHGYFWAGPWEALARITGIPCQKVATDRVMIGSFVLNRPPQCDYNELLLGDPTLPMGRLYFPGRFRESDDPVLQIEYAVPAAGDAPTDGGHWRQAWWQGLTRLGIVGAGHEIVEFDFKSVTMHFNGYGMEGEALRDSDPSLLQANSNLHPVVPSMANLNLNRYVPRVVAQVASILARD